MNKVYKRIDNGLQNASYEECVVNKDNIKHAVRSLKSGKSDGDIGLWSNNIKYGGDLLCDHISKLITAMYVHGHSPDELFTASITLRTDFVT